MVLEWLPDLSIAAAAALAIMLMISLYLLAELIKASFSQVPVIGSWVAARMDSVMRAARNGMIATLDATLHGLAWTWHVIVNYYTGIIDIIRRVAWDISNGLWRLQHVWIPRLERDIRKAYHTLFQAAESYAHQLYKQAETDIGRLRGDMNNGFDNLRKWAAAAIAVAAAGVTALVWKLYRQLEQRIKSAQDAAEWYAYRIVQQVKAELAAGLAAARAYTDSLFRQAQTEILQAEANAEAYAAKQAAAAAVTAERTVNLDARDAMATVWAGVGTQVKDLEQAIGTGMPDVAALLAVIPASPPATAAAAVAADASAIPPMMRLMTDCVVPNCDNLSKFGKDISQLGSILTGAAFAAFMAAMILDPEPTAKLTVDLLDVPVADTVTAVRDLIGV